MTIVAVRTTQNINRQQIRMDIASILSKHILKFPKVLDKKIAESKFMNE